jgi:ketosteroid isomerase-like protein
MKQILVIAAAALLAGIAVGHSEAADSEGAAKLSAVAPSARPAAAIVEAFHSALRSGDTQAALSHLDKGALIYEAGGVERGRKEYASHHLGADSAFARAVPGTVTRRVGEAVGDFAWIATEGRATGSFKDNAVDRVTTETMILRRARGAWKIVHIHWSSAVRAK